MTERVNMQDVGHPANFDYDVGSPHLRHPALRRWIVEVLREVVSERFSVSDRVRVLEIGAGHGSFTDHLLALGAHVTLTEMSEGSALLLADRYAHNPRARVAFDPTGEGAEIAGEHFDVVVCISVLHHIPDYSSAIARWVEATSPGGAFVSFQDPLWYPRRTTMSMAASRAAFLAWRLTRGDLVEGTRSRIRRSRGRLDETNPRDMVEFHVVRNGCDEDSIVAQLGADFDDVNLHAYWSTQAGALQTVGTRLGLRSEFGVVALGRKPA